MSKKAESFESAGIGNERIVLDFEHLPKGKNCQISAIRKMLNHYGHSYSEDMLFGMASGLGFIYWHMKGMFAPFVGAMNVGRFPGIPGRIIERLGGSVKVLKSKSVARAHKHLLETLHQNQLHEHSTSSHFYPYKKKVQT